MFFWSTNFQYFMWQLSQVTSRLDWLHLWNFDVQSAPNVLDKTVVLWIQRSTFSTHSFNMNSKDLSLTAIHWTNTRCLADAQTAGTVTISLLPDVLRKHSELYEVPLFHAWRVALCDVHVAGIPAGHTDSMWPWLTLLEVIIWVIIVISVFVLVWQSYILVCWVK